MCRHLQDGHVGTLRPSEMASRSIGELNEGEARALCQRALLFCDTVVNCCTRELCVVLWVIGKYTRIIPLKPSSHYMYRTLVTICTVQWSLYVPYSGHYMYHTVVTVCTAQWSLYVPHSGHYMYRTVVTICNTQWSLYVPHSGHYM